MFFIFFFFSSNKKKKMSQKNSFLIPDIEHHRLKSVWTFSYCIPPRDSQNKTEQWERYLHHFSDFMSFEDFYGILNTLDKPATLPVSCRYYVFRKGIKPIWEDKANEDGFIFSVEYEIGTPKSKGKAKGKDFSELAEEKWTDLTLSVLAGDFPNVDKINGIEFFHRKSGFRVALWTKRMNDNEEKETEAAVIKILSPNPPPLHKIKLNQSTVQRASSQPEINEEKKEK